MKAVFGGLAFIFIMAGIMAASQESREGKVSQETGWVILIGIGAAIVFFILNKVYRDSDVGSFKKEEPSKAKEDVKKNTSSSRISSSRSSYYNSEDYNICSRCGGSGYLSKYSHVQGGVCFRCGGSGFA